MSSSLPKNKDKVLDANEGRRAKATSAVPVQQAPRTENVLRMKSNNDGVNKSPLNSAQSPAPNNVAKSCKNPVIEPVKERSKDKEQLPEGWKKVEGTHKPCTNQPNDNVLAAAGPRMAYTKFQKEIKLHKSENPWIPKVVAREAAKNTTDATKFKTKYNDTLGLKHDNSERFTAATPRMVHTKFQKEIKLHKSENPWIPKVVAREAAKNTTDATKTETKYSNTSGIKHDNRERFTAARPKMVHTKFQKEVKLHKSENPWIPKVVEREAAKNTTGATKLETKPTKNKTEDLKTTVNSMLYKLKQLTESFAMLPVNTMKDLENTVDLVFQKAIRERNFTPLYASLCSAMQSVQVTSDDGKNTQVSFKTLILRKCQSQFQDDRVRRTKGVNKLKEINLCEDPVKKKELRFAYQENERKLHERSVRNCRFMGELFNQNMIKPSIMTYCTSTLAGEISDESLECLCDLLKTAGRQLEACCDMKRVFDKLESLTSHKNVSSLMKCKINDVINLRKNKWSS